MASMQEVKKKKEEEAKAAAQAAQPKVDNTSVSKNVPITKNGSNFIVDKQTAAAIVNKKQQDEAFTQAVNTYNQKQSGKPTPLQDELANVPIPRAEDIATQTANPFQETIKEGVGIKGSGLNIIASSNLGQGFAGKDFLDNLKNNPELQKSYLSLQKYMMDNNLTPEQVTSDPFTQGALKLSLNENDLKILNEGKADVKGLAIAIEGLPISSQITKWTGGALTPTSAFNKIKSLNTQVSDLTSKMDNWNEAITRNPQLATQYESLIEETEQQVLDLQSRIKLLTIQSPIFQNSPEDVENIGVDIDKALTKTAKLKSVVINTRYGGV